MSVLQGENEYLAAARERAMLEPIELGTELNMPKMVAREKLVHEYAWAVPNDHALETLQRFGPLVELGAGNGYWAYLLLERGVDIVAYDPVPYQEGQYADLGALGRVERREWAEVLEGDHTVITEHQDRTMFLCWPSYGLPWAREALEAYRGDYIAYVGEMGGCTADDLFHAKLAVEFKQIEHVDIPRFFGLHDYLSIWQR